MLVDVVRKLAKRVPLRIARMAPARFLDITLEGSANRRLGVWTPRDALAESPVNEQISPFQIFGPDHVRHVVAHPSQHRSQFLRPRLTDPQRLFRSPALKHFDAQPLLSLDFTDHRLRNPKRSQGKNDLPKNRRNTEQQKETFILLKKAIEKVQRKREKRKHVDDQAVPKRSDTEEIARRHHRHRNQKNETIGRAAGVLRQEYRRCRKEAGDERAENTAKNKQLKSVFLRQANALDMTPEQIERGATRKQEGHPDQERVAPTALVVHQRRKESPRHEQGHRISLGVVKESPNSCQTNPFLRSLVEGLFKHPFRFQHRCIDFTLAHFATEKPMTFRSWAF